MSYDLYFFKRKTSRLSEEQVAKYLDENFPLNISEVDTQWMY